MVKGQFYPLKHRTPAAKDSNSSSPRSHQLLIALWGKCDFMSPFSIHGWTLMLSFLCRPYAGNYICCEFMNAQNIGF